jgi:hypothetical protein
MDNKKANSLRNSFKFKKFANYLVWNQTPDEVLADINSFLANIMARFHESTFIYAKEHFGLTDEDFRDAFRNSDPGTFIYQSNWDRWNKILGIDPPLPPPLKYPNTSLF